MIANQTELRVAFRNLHILEQSLQALREQLATENPDLLHVSAPSYERRIADLQKEIAAYLYAHPADVSALTLSVPVPAEREAIAA
jgi:hypothetical protein